MIEKMKFLNISGPIDDIDRMVKMYLSKYEIQLENPTTELKTTRNLLPFAEANPYVDPLARTEQFIELLGEQKEAGTCSLSDEAMLSLIQELNHDCLTLQDEKDALVQKRASLQEELDALEPFRSLDVDVDRVLHYQFIKARFGRIPSSSYQKFETYLMDDLNVVFLEGSRDADHVYGCYFVANADAGKVDAAFHSMHFERIPMPDEATGTPADICDDLIHQVNQTTHEIHEKDLSIQDLLSVHATDLLGARDRLKELSDDFDVRKMAARMQDEEADAEYYLLCGWMSDDDTQAFLDDTKNDDQVFVLLDEDSSNYFDGPPTKLKNPRFFKPFQMFMEMYGLPQYNELDPTIFVALTYTFIFGAMFGDVGQGICLFIGGGLLYLIRKMNLAGIISIAGIFSTFFGFMYGSVFGFEGIIPALWLKPSEALLDLPFIGQLNTVFVVAIAFGMGLNMLVMVFQIINAAKCHDLGDVWFSNNGVAGLVFYGFLVLTIVLYMTGHAIPGNILLVVFLGVPVLLFLFKEPLTNLIEHRQKKMEEGVVMFLVEGIFELIETMLSYFSNTLSFVRIGAFAVSHGAMMEVVLMLTGAEAGHPNWIGVGIGNIIVMGMEGLIVGIQVLRLEYYELFSRYYKGGGRAFTPFRKTEKKKAKK